MLLVLLLHLLLIRCEAVADDTTKQEGKQDNTQLTQMEGEQSIKLLTTLQDIFSPVDSAGVRIFFPLVLVSTLYLALVIWASSTLHWADQQLYTTISELNAKTDQISEGIAALAQIYIDNYPFAYRAHHNSLGTLARQAKKSQ